MVLGQQPCWVSLRGGGRDWGQRRMKPTSTVLWKGPSTCTCFLMVFFHQSSLCSERTPICRGVCQLLKDHPHLGSHLSSASLVENLRSHKCQLINHVAQNQSVPDLDSGLPETGHLAGPRKAIKVLVGAAEVTLVRLLLLL
jgi:hypothetical protein